MKTRTYFFAANRSEGCGHEHRTKKAAQRCADRANLRPDLGPKLYVCRVTVVNGKRSNGVRV